MSKRLTYAGKNEVRISPNIICDNPHIFISAKFNVLKCFTVIDSSQYPVTLIISLFHISIDYPDTGINVCGVYSSFDVQCSKCNKVVCGRYNFVAQTFPKAL